jgi:uncharacterized membrane protein YkvA (DUF1232 family)
MEFAPPRRSALVALYRALQRDPDGLRPRVRAVPRMARAALLRQYRGAGRLLLLGLACAYISSPLDLIPDVLPGVGQIDDLLVALYALGAVLDGAAHFEQVSDAVLAACRCPWRPPGTRRRGWTPVPSKRGLVAAGQVETMARSITDHLDLPAARSGHMWVIELGSGQAQTVIVDGWPARRRAVPTVDGGARWRGWQSSLVGDRGSGRR